MLRLAPAISSKCGHLPSPSPDDQLELVRHEVVKHANGLGKAVVRAELDGDGVAALDHLRSGGATSPARSAEDTSWHLDRRVKRRQMAVPLVGLGDEGAWLARRRGRAGGSGRLASAHTGRCRPTG